MTCDEGRELIQHSIDSDLDSQETVLMNEHIRTCPDCAAFLERMTLLSKNLADLPRVAPPFSLVDAILPKLEIIDAEARVAEARAAQTGNVVPEEPAELPRRRSRSTLRRVAGAIAAGLVAGLVIVTAPSLFHSSSNDRDSNDSVALSEAPAAKSEARSFSTEASQDSAGFSADTSQSENGAAAPSVTGSLEAAPSASVKFSEPLPSEGESAAPATDRSDTAGSGEMKEITGSIESNSVAPQKGIAPTATLSPSAEATGKSLTGNSGGEGLAPSEGEETNDALEDLEMSGLLSVPFPALEWISPDQKLKAVAEKQRISVYSNEDHSLIFQSALHEGESLSSVYWEQDSSLLHYSWKDSEGNIKDMVWDASANAESPASEWPKESSGK